MSYREIVRPPSTIWKYALKLEDKQYIDMPKYAAVIHLGLDPAGIPCLWAWVIPENDLVQRQFDMYETGASLSKEPGRHVGSFIHGPYVWHVFDPLA